MNNHDQAASIGAGVIGLGFLAILSALFLLVIIGMWKVFTKAGQPGWACLIPIYNLYVLAEIAGKPGWWVILCFIPVVSLVILIIITAGVARNFGYGIGFTVGLLFLPYIFYPILGFGGATYGYRS